MPKAKPAQITLRDGTILRQDKDFMEFDNHFVTTYAQELQTVDEKLPKKFWERTHKTVKVQKMVKIPIKSWPLSAITRVDWGYVSQAEYKLFMDAMAKAKQAEDAKKGRSDGVVEDKSTAGGAGAV